MQANRCQACDHRAGPHLRKICLAPKVHAAEPQDGHLEACAPQVAVLHGCHKLSQRLPAAVCVVRLQEHVPLSAESCALRTSCRFARAPADLVGPVPRTGPTSEGQMDTPSVRGSLFKLCSGAAGDTAVRGIHLPSCSASTTDRSVIWDGSLRV